MILEIFDSNTENSKINFPHVYSSNVKFLEFLATLECVKRKEGKSLKIKIQSLIL